MTRHIPHLLVPGPWDSEQLDVGERARHHLEKVLRLAGVQQVTYTDGSGRCGRGRYESGIISRGAETWDGARRHNVTIAVAPPKSKDRVRFLVEKLAELSVARLVWLETSHAEGRPPRLDKAEAWAVAALEQSRGCWRMEIGDSARLDDLATLGPLFVAQPGGGPIEITREVADPVLCVGPEGGFAEGEIPRSATKVSLGSTVLRVETAAIAGAVLIGRPG